MAPTTFAAEQQALARGDQSWTAVCLECVSKNLPSGGVNVEVLPGSLQEALATLAVVVGKRGQS